MKFAPFLTGALTASLSHNLEVIQTGFGRIFIFYFILNPFVELIILVVPKLEIKYYLNWS